MERPMQVDRHVFNMLLVFEAVFMVLVVMGTSVPAWWVIHEGVANFSTCATAKQYVDDAVVSSWPSGTTNLELMSSLWFVHTTIQTEDRQTWLFTPYIFVKKQYSSAHHLVTDLPPATSLSSGTLALMTFTFLSVGVVCGWMASERRGRQVYYGLSAILITSGVCTWVVTAVYKSQSFLAEMAVALCLEEWSLASSTFLQVMTLSCAIVAFVLGFVLIQFALLRQQAGTQCDTDEAGASFVKFGAGDSIRGTAMDQVAAVDFCDSNKNVMQYSYKVRDL